MKKPFVTTENFPEFPGGKEALKKFIDRNLKYKAEYRSDTLVTDIIVRFVVSKTGTITDPKILKGENTDFAKAVIKAINIMPEWKAGRQCGLHVPVYYSILIQYDTKKKSINLTHPYYYSKH